MAMEKLLDKIAETNDPDELVNLAREAMEMTSPAGAFVILFAWMKATNVRLDAIESKLTRLAVGGSHHL